MAQNDIQISVPIIGTTSNPVAYADQIYDETSEASLDGIVGRVAALEEGGGGGDDSELTGRVDSLEDEVAKLSFAGMTFAFTATPSACWKGTATNIALRATASEACVIELGKKGNPSPMNDIPYPDATAPGEDNKKTERTYTVKSVTADTTFYAGFSLGSNSKRLEATVRFYDKVYYGIGAADDDLSEITSYQSKSGAPVTSPLNLTYTFAPTAAKPRAYILVPTSMSALNLSKIDYVGGLGNFGMELIRSDYQRDGATYNVYRSLGEYPGTQISIMPK